jgi:hypothetical protein
VALKLREGRAASGFTDRVDRVRATRPESSNFMYLYVSVCFIFLRRITKFFVFFNTGIDCRMSEAEFASGQKRAQLVQKLAGTELVLGVEGQG